ncbi:MAG: hypothetical protein Q9159_002396 [Coniocarpon cinnabarinum]
MTEQQSSLKEAFRGADNLRAKAESKASIQDTQSRLHAAIAQYEKCSEIAEEVSLFSSNEELEDISSSNLQYLLIDYQLGQLTFRLSSADRKITLQHARSCYERFLTRLDAYRILDKQSSDTFERYQEDPARFSVVLTSDASRRRDVKIANFKAEKALKEKLQYLNKNANAMQHDETLLRDLHLTNIMLCTHQAFQSLEGIAQELELLAMAASLPHERFRDRESTSSNSATNATDYSERLDPPLSQLAANGRHGPILSNEGRPLRPFTLLDTRQRMQQGVFRPDHNLPTMTIDEYLEEERKRGGIIEGGGPQSQVRPQVDEDDVEKADEATMKAREWDEFVEANPKGSGNTMNMG